ncbi:MAG: tRNA-dihydrouridine synthase [Parcubacteria group bacterium GW2011_GWF2_38_76]|nr:MAG: tRNA-dihydrouridine synthase [Parcubacteria group bacterium GW2011_GWF2_38_76]HBM46006.1 tRNA-dihydrouridine synthase [Patescibacteria group bacterium]
MKHNNFWGKLKNNKKPFFCLAPMADVTDAPFRQIIAKYSKFTRNGEDRGGPDVTWTEMVSCDGFVRKDLLAYRKQGDVGGFPQTVQERLALSFIYDEIERPIVAQVFGGDPKTFYETAVYLSELGFDGIDINMGCPDHGINKQNAGANLIKSPELAKEIIKATKEGAGGIPVSVKTRIGYNKNEIDTWIPNLLEAEPAALTIHGRTRKEMSKVPAHWDQIAKCVEMAKGSNTVIIGNGDVKSLEEGRQRAEESGVDGIMIGRGIFGNPWLFNDKIKKEELPIKEVLKVLLEHTRLFEKILGSKKPFVLMRKHFGSYVTGFEGAKELRMKLMETESADDVDNIISQFL